MALIWNKDHYLATQTRPIIEQALSQSKNNGIAGGIPASGRRNAKIVKRININENNTVK